MTTASTDVVVDGIAFVLLCIYIGYLRWKYGIWFWESDEDDE